MIKNAKLGVILGTFLGSILGSTGTILVMKKLKKLEEKQFKKDESEAVNEVEKYYENKINQLKNGGIKIDYSTKIEEKKEPENATKISVIDGKKEVITEKESPITNPKFLYQDRLAEEKKNKEQAVDYSKITRVKYDDLAKEYDREEPEVEEEHYPEQITMEMFEDEIAYRKETLMYYEQDGVFATLDDIPVNDLYDEKYFGSDNLLLFGTMQASLDGKSSTNELYLRDRLHNVDFHLIYNSTECFSDVIKGGLESD